MPEDPGRTDEDIQSAQKVCGNLRQLRLPISCKAQVFPDIILPIDSRIRDTYVGQMLESPRRIWSGSHFTVRICYFTALAA